MAHSAFHESRQNEINFRATRLVGSILNEKVGFIQSDSAAGRVVQALGSLALPGDLSDIRRPIRSTLYEALTPGGGGGRGLGSTIGPVRRALRCPSGFEFGGRYATRGFGNCGRQLFEIPTPGDGGTGPAFPTINRSFGMVGLIKPESRRILGLGNDIRSIQIQRNASIPRIGARNQSRASTAIDAVIDGISSSKENQRFMVRSDGFVLKPSIDSNLLKRIRKNPDMNDATFVVNAPNPLKMAEEEVPLLWNSNVAKVVVALPGGGSLSLERSGDLSMGQKRRLTRIWQQSEARDRLNAGQRLRSLAEASDGKIKYTEKIGSNKPNEMITIEDSNGKISATRRWIFDSYLSDSAPGRGDNKPLKEVPSDSDSTSVDNSIQSEKEALEALKNGTRLEDIPSKFIGSAVNEKEVFDRRSVRPGVSRLQDREGRVYYDIDGKKDFGAVTARTASDIRAIAGLPSGNVKFNGEGVRRGIVVPDSENITGARVDRSGGLSSIDPDQIVRLAATDYLLDEPNRNPSSINSLDLNGKKLAYVLPSIDPKSAGLSAEELDERRRAVLGDFYSTDNVYSQALSRISRSRKRQLNTVLDDILKRLEAFNWDEYQTNLGLDGDLSPAEKRHIEILKSLFKIRLNRIKSSKKMFLNIIGASSINEKSRFDLSNEEKGLGRNLRGAMPNNNPIDGDGDGFYSPRRGMPDRTPVPPKPSALRPPPYRPNTPKPPPYRPSGPRTRSLELANDFVKRKLSPFKITKTRKVNKELNDAADEVVEGSFGNLDAESAAEDIIYNLGLAYDYPDLDWPEIKKNLEKAIQLKKEELWEDQFEVTEDLEAAVQKGEAALKAEIDSVYDAAQAALARAKGGEGEAFEGTRARYLLRQLRRYEDLLDDLSNGEKGLGEAIGRGISRARRALGRFDPDAEDGDNDQVVQEGTPWERPAPKKKRPRAAVRPRGIVNRPVTQSSGDRYDENWYDEVWPELRRRRWREAREIVPEDREKVRAREAEFDKKYPRPEAPEYDRNEFIADLEATGLGDMEIDYRVAGFDRYRRERIAMDQAREELGPRGNRDPDEYVRELNRRRWERVQELSKEKVNNPEEEKGIGDNLRNLARGAGRGVMRRLDEAANRAMTGVRIVDGDGDGFYSRGPGQPDNTPVPRRPFGPRLGVRDGEGNLRELPGTPYQNANRMNTGRRKPENDETGEPDRRPLKPEDIGEDDIWDDGSVPYGGSDENSDDIWDDYRRLDDYGRFRWRSDDYGRSRRNPRDTGRDDAWLGLDEDDIWND